MVKSFFQFSRKERRGVLILIITLISLAVYPDLIHYFFPSQPQGPQDLSYLLRYPLPSVPPPKNGTPAETEVRGKAVVNPPAPFDPNKLDAAGWQQLGIPRKTAEIIRRYLDRGGEFRVPDDLRKIYGMREQDAIRLMPYVRIQRPSRDVDSGIRQKAGHPTGNYYTATGKNTPLVIDINTADSAGWVKLPGIGPGYARRIIRYRKKLGGFYDIRQVAETFGLPDSTFNGIRSLLACKPVPLVQVPVNEASEEQLSLHPYISRKLARELVAYRMQHGALTGPQSLSILVNLEAEEGKKLLPYLRF